MTAAETRRRDSDTVATAQHVTGTARVASGEKRAQPRRSPYLQPSLRLFWHEWRQYKDQFYLRYEHRRVPSWHRRHEPFIRSPSTALEIRLTLAPV